MRKPLDILGEWQTKLRSCAVSKSSAARLFTICGPSGSGKTAVVQGLLQQFNGYVEAVDDNPHLLRLVEGTPDFDALANQQWFLNRIAKFIHNANSGSPLILDQDPAAIVKVYSRMFKDDGLIDNAGYRTLLTDLLHLEGNMSRWRTPRTIFLLDAPEEVLRQRVSQRSGTVATPSLKWFATVRSYFHELAAELPNVILVPSADVTPQQISSQLTKILRVK